MAKVNEPAPYIFELYDAEPNGVASTLGGLMGQNLEKFPSRRRIARRIPRPVAVYSTDTDATATIVFEDNKATVYNDRVGRPSVTVKASVAQILDVSQLSMKAGGLLPVGFFTKRGGRVLGQILTHKLVVKGLLIHTVTALQFIALVSVEG
jgi:hypothetical protein